LLPSLAPGKEAKAGETKMFVGHTKRKVEEVSLLFVTRLGVLQKEREERAHSSFLLLNESSSCPP